MGNQAAKPEQDNDRVIDSNQWPFLQPFYPYFEDQIRADAMRIESTYETNNYTIITLKDTLRINLRVIPKEEFAKWVVNGDMYSPLEKYISFDKSVSDSSAAVMAACNREEGLPAEYATGPNKDTYSRIEKETRGKSVLPIDLTNASILLSPALRLNLIQKYLTKPYSISVYETTTSKRVYKGEREVYGINMCTNFVLSWVRIPAVARPVPNA